MTTPDRFDEEAERICDAWCKAGDGATLQEILAAYLRSSAPDDLSLILARVDGGAGGTIAERVECLVRAVGSAIGERRALSVPLAPSEFKFNNSNGAILCATCRRIVITPARAPADGVVVLCAERAGRRGSASAPAPSADVAGLVEEARRLAERANVYAAGDDWIRLIADVRRVLPALADALAALTSAASAVMFDARGQARDWPIGVSDDSAEEAEQLAALERLKAVLRGGDALAARAAAHRAEVAPAPDIDNASEAECFDCQRPVRLCVCKTSWYKAAMAIAQRSTARAHRAEMERLRVALRAAEWEDEQPRGNRCPTCKAWASDEPGPHHEPGCEIAAALSAPPSPSPAAEAPQCPCESDADEPGPHIASCPWSDPNYTDGEPSPLPAAETRVVEAAVRRAEEIAKLGLRPPRVFRFADADLDAAVAALRELRGKP